MLETSLLGLSGQLWKLFVAILALIVGSVAPLFPALGVSWTAATVITVVGYAFGLISIQCKYCGSRWLWEATKGSIGYAPLFKQSSCPKCEQSFA